MTRISIPLGLVLVLLASAAAAAPPLPLVADIEAFFRETDPAKRRAIRTKLLRSPYADVESALRDARFTREPREGRTVLAVDSGNGERRTSYVLVVPPGYDPSRRYPLLVAVHGAGADARWEERIWRRFTDANGWVLACPDGDRERSGEGWGSSDEERGAILAVTRDARRRASVDPDRVYLAGESRGGHATWETGILTPDLWAGLRPCVGGPRVWLRPALTNLVPVGMYDVQGARDDARLVAAVREACAALEKAGGDVTYVEAPDLGHQDVPGEQEKLFPWAAARRRRLMLREFSFVLGGGSGRRAFWVRVDRLASGVPDPRKVGMAVRVRPGASEEEKRKAYVTRLARMLGRVEAKIAGPNRIVIRTKNVTRLTVYLSDDLVDLDRPISVMFNGHTKRQRVTRSVAFLLDHVRETGDTGRRFGASLTLP